MCFERYILLKYPHKDMTLVLKFMWNIVNDSDFIDNSAYKYMEIIPDYLYEAPDFDSLEFDHVTREEYNKFLDLIPRPETDPDLNIIMHHIYDVAMLYAYTVVELNSQKIRNDIAEVDGILVKNKIELPDVKLIPSDSKEWDGWGNFINPYSLSMILKK